MKSPSGIAQMARAMAVLLTVAGVARARLADAEDGGTRSAAAPDNANGCHCDEGKGCYCPQHGWVCNSQATCSQTWREHLSHCKAGATGARGRPGAADARGAPGKRGDDLDSNVTLLKASPSDRTLRLKILRMVSMMKTPPAKPEEVVTYEGRAEYAMKNAKSEADFADAAKEYEKALLVAPWVPENYCNQGEALEKAGHLAEAKDSYEWCATATTDEGAALEVRKRAAGVGYALERARKNSFDGRWCVEPCVGHGDIYIAISRGKDAALSAVFEGSGTSSEPFQAEGRHITVRIPDTLEPGGSIQYDLQLADDGETLSGFRTRIQGESAGTPAEMNLRRAK